MSKTGDDRKRALSFSSENVVVQRWFGGEILDHSPKSVRMGFMASGNAPLLMHHDMRQQIGVIDSANIKDGVGRAIARFGRSASAADALQNVDDTIYRNTSVGYRVHEMRLESTANGEDTYRIVDWEPFEASIVGVPADSTVGIGRGTREEIVSTPAADAAIRSTAMAEGKTAAGNAADNTGAAAKVEITREEVKTPNAIELEGQRKRAIENLCKSSKIDDRTRDFWITSGTSVEKVSEDIVTIMEERGKTKPTSVANLDLTAEETQRFSLTRAIAACADGNWAKAGFEAECSRTIAQRANKPLDPKRFFVPYDVQARPIDPNAIRSQQRALRGGDLNGGGMYYRADTVGSAPAGGYLVQTVNVGFIELLRNRSVCFRMGARALSGLVGNVNVPKQNSAATAAWLGSETTQITESDQVFGQMALSPKTVGGYTEISRLLLLQSSPDVEGIVNADLAAIVALAVDKGGLSGSGSAGQPLGIANTSGIGSPAGMTTIAYAGQLNFQVAVANANVMPVAGGYVTTPTVAALLMQRTRFANTATPLWDGNLWDANGALQCAGFPGMSSNQIAAGTMFFGDWSQLVIAEWGVLEIEVNPYANFQAGIIGVRALMTVDVGLRYAAAFAVGASIT